LKNRKLTLLCSIGLILVLVLSTILAACAQETAAPGAPTKISPQVPSQPATPATPSTPATPAKPAPAPAAEVFKWRLVSCWPAGQPLYSEMIMYLAAQIEEQSMGRITVTPYPGGTLYPATEALEATQGGVSEMAVSDGSYIAGKLPVAGVHALLPMLMPDAESIPYVDYELGADKIMAREFAKFNIQYFGPVAGSGKGHGLISKNPIRTLDDFKTMTVRTFGAYMDLFAKMGAKTIFIPHEEVYMALQLGTIDAYNTGRDAEWAYRSHEICKYYEMPAVGTGAGVMFANMDAYNKLTPDLQLAVMTAAKLTSGWMIYAYNPLYNDQVTVWFDNYGLERIDWGPEVVAALVEKAEEIWDERASADPASAEYIELAKDYAAKKRAGKL